MKSKRKNLYKKLEFKAISTKKYSQLTVKKMEKKKEIRIHHVFREFYTVAFESRVCHTLNKRNEVNLSKNQKLNRKKSNLKVNKYQDFFLKECNKITKTYLRMFTSFINLKKKPR